MALVPILVWLTPHRMMTLATERLLAWVPSLQSKSRDGRPPPPATRNSGPKETISHSDIHGDHLSKKPSNTLRTGFQNIGGFPIDKTKLKEDLIRAGITIGSFDIFGIAETNIDWWTMPEDHKLYYQSKHWWDTLHLSHAFNSTACPSSAKQYGGTAVFSINRSAHRAIDQGSDITGLGR